MSNLENSCPRPTVHWMHDRAITISVPNGHVHVAIGEGALMLTDIYVEPDHRGNGVAGHLLNAARELAEDSGAGKIIADLTSPQVVRAAQKAFGEDAVTIYASYPTTNELIDPADEILLPAAAFLNYVFPTPDNPAQQ